MGSAALSAGKESSVTTPARYNPLTPMNDQLGLFSKRKSRADQIYAEFEVFHKANRDIWGLFKSYADQARACGRKCYSANAIFERIRWFLDIETKGGDFKLNNNFRAYYARMYHVATPQADGFFRNRVLTSEQTNAHDEAKLCLKLKALI